MVAMDVEADALQGPALPSPIAHTRERDCAGYALPSCASVSGGNR